METYGELGGECILRTCTDCGYAWLEQCADAAESQLVDRQ